MKKFSLFLCFLFLLLSFWFPVFSSAQSSSTRVVVDLKDLDSQTSQEILRLMKKKEGERGVIIAEKITPSQVTQWKEIALGLGMAVKELCKALNVEINAFLKTDAGKLLTFILIWKLIGASVLSFLIKLLIWGTIFVMTIVSFKYFHTNRRVKKNDGTIEYIERYHWKEPDRGDVGAKPFSVFAHVCILLMSALIIAFAV